jgi:hypothetical protein
MGYKSTVLIFILSISSLCFSTNDSVSLNPQISNFAIESSCEKKLNDNKSPILMYGNHQAEMPDTEKYEPQEDNTGKIVLGIFCGIGCIFVTVVICAVLFEALSLKGDIM